jgi:hypothetical protein
VKVAYPVVGHVDRCSLNRTRSSTTNSGSADC